MGSNSSKHLSGGGKLVEVPGLKIAVIGDSRAGKSCILTRYIRNQFSYEYIQTQKVAVENVVKKLNVPGHAAVPISFWDIPGNEDIHLYPSYFKDLDAVIVVVDVTDPESRESGRLWRQTVLDTASFTARDTEENTQITNGTTGEWELKRKIQNVNDIPFLLLGNKHDLVKQANLRDEKTENTGLNEENIQHYPDFTRYLDEVAVDGFHGSALVSARANDLSVDGAIQSFLRQILEKDYVARRWQAHENVHKGKRPRYKFQPQMEVVGFKEIDDEFSKADEIIYRVTSLRNYQKESLDKFCEQCVKGGVVESAEAVNMQDCLVSLKEKLESMDLKLKLTLLDEFFILEVKASEDNAVLETPIRYAIKTFNKEYAAVTKAILAEYPLAKDKLNRIVQKVEKLCQQHEVSSSDTSKNTDVISDQSSRDRTPVERNLAMIQHITRKCHDSLAHIQRSVKQAKAAFVW